MIHRLTLRLNSGHVTYSQFLQCLAYLDLSVTPEEQSVIILRFGSAKGVKYQEVSDADLQQLIVTTIIVVVVPERATA